MFDRYDAGEQAVLVHIYFSQDKDMEDLREFESLVSSAGVEAMQVITGSRKAPHPKYFVGEGKAVEIADAVKQPAHLLCCLIMRCLRLRNVTRKLSANAVLSIARG